MPFRFLDLSAELRNRIYTYAFDAIRKSECEPEEHLALTHVCRQIRIEFRPILMHRPLHPRGCVSWLHAFLPGWDDPSVDKANFFANLHAGSVTECLYHDNSFLAFLRLYIEAPHVNVYIPRDRMGERAMSMLRCKDEWAKLLKSGHVAAVFCTRVSLHILFTRELTAPWLITGSGGEKYVDHGATRFVQDLGAMELPIRNMPAAVLGIQADKEGCAPLCHHALGRELPWGPIKHCGGCSLWEPWSEE